MRQRWSKLNSVEKALKILLVLITHDEGMGTSDLSEELGLTMPTTSRLLSILSKHDFVRRNSAAKKYVLGKSALDIGKFAYRHIGSQLVSIAKPHLDALRDTVEESVMLEVMAGDSAMLVYRATGTHVVSIVVKAGTLIPAHVSPGAMAILAFSPSETVNNVFKKELTRYTPRTIKNPELLKENLKEIKRKGVAFAFGEYNLDVNAIGAPIFNHEKKPIAAVVITMPVYRAKYHKQSKLISLLKETAARISDQLIDYEI